MINGDVGGGIGNALNGRRVVTGVILWDRTLGLRLCVCVRVCV